MARKRKIKGAFCKRVQEPKSHFAKKSFRWKRSGKTWINVACPKGHYHLGRRGPRKCDVGMRAHEILVPARGRSCPVGKKVRKGR